MTRHRASCCPLRTLLLLILPGVLLLCTYTWYQTTPYIQAQQLAAARERWDDRPFERYRFSFIHTNPGVPGDRLADTYTVTDTSRPEAAEYSMRDYFAMIEQFQHHPWEQCAAPTLSCNRAITNHVAVAYDPHLGYPQRIHWTRTLHPDWFHPPFWVWLLSSGTWRACEHITCTRTQYITKIEITHLEPLP